MTRNIVSIATALFLLVAMSIQLGCNTRIERQINSVAIENEPLAQLSHVQQKQKARAIAAKDKLFESLLGELVNSMDEKGPAKSISVCKTRAAEIASQVSAGTGVRIGRTSFKLRNESNIAPEWAASFVEDQIEKPIEVALPNSELGVLLPIRLMPTCVLCHGTNEQVMPDVKAAIVSNYPNDTATGFAEGDIRGYFWIEVPAEYPNDE